jgi:hypothetical protein
LTYDPFPPDRTYKRDHKSATDKIYSWSPLHRENGCISLEVLVQAAVVEVADCSRETVDLRYRSTMQEHHQELVFTNVPDALV